MSIKTDSLFKQAYELYGKGLFSEAAPLFNTLLKKYPRNESVLYLAGTLRCQLGQFQAGYELLHKVLRINPKHVEALNNLGMACVSLRHIDEAEACYRRALALKPNYPHALNNLGGVLDSQGALNESVVCYQKALKLMPDYPEAMFNLGRTLQFLERYSEAEQWFLKLLAINPNHYNALNQLGAICKLQHRPEDALGYLQQALAVNSGNYGVYNNLAAIYQQLNQFDKALEYYDKSIALEPDNASIKWNRATVLLMLGRLDEGWREFEWRRDASHWQALPFPEWQGQDLNHKTLLVLAEQGLGDEILLASCLNDVIARSGHCIIECDPRLGALYQRSFPEATIKAVIRRNRDWLTELSAIDYCIPLGSLPRFLRRSLSDFPDESHYLRTDSAENAVRRKQLEALGSGLKIGICWRSQITREGRHLNYSRLEEWQAIFSLADVQFINLQYDECQAELNAVKQKFNVTVHQLNGIDLKNDLDIVAAVCHELDLVISAGTALAEIAAAVGTVVWRLEPTETGWIGLGTDYLPWHPHVRIFKQQQRGDWRQPLKSIADALKSFDPRDVSYQNLPPGVRSHSVSGAESSDYLQKIRQLLNSGNAQTTLQEIAQLLSGHEDDAELWELKGVAELSQNRLREAEQSLRHALSLQPKATLAMTRLAKTLSILGREQEAEECFRQAITLSPNWAEAHNDLANLLYDQRRDSEAEEQYLLALRYKPDLVEAHSNLGSLLLDQGRTDEAIRSFKEALRLKPHFAEAHYNLANAYSDQKRYDQAIAAFQQALLYRPDFAQAYFYLANCHVKQENYSEAEACYQKAIDLKKDYLSAYLGLSNILCRQAKYDLTESLLLDALAAFPQAPEVYSELGYLQRELGNYQESEAYLLKGLELDANCLPVLLNLAALQDSARRFEEAKETFLKALELASDNAEIYANLAKVCSNLDQYSQAEGYCRQALAINPELGSAYVNLSYALQMQGRHQEAIALCHEAIAKWPGSRMLYQNLIRGLFEQGALVEVVNYSELVLEAIPDYYDIKVSLALALLSMGDLKNGWQAFQDSKDCDAGRRNFPYPEWRGGAIDGKLLIYANQGVGDEVLFASCFADLTGRVPHCVIECDPRLASLFQRSFPEAEVYGTPRLERDWLTLAEPITAQISMDIVPSIVRQRFADFPSGATRYLKPDPQRMAHWRAQVKALGDGLKIGIAWRSGLLKGGRNLYYSDLDEWGEIFKIPGIQFINLQYDDCQDELNRARERFSVAITDFPAIDLKNDLDDAAALSSVMDLVISAGTTSAEIAAAVGVPVWRMEAVKPSWALFGTEHMPWHPNVQLFKQTQLGDWQTVLQRIAEKLIQVMNLSIAQARLQLQHVVFDPKTLLPTIDAEFMQVQLAAKHNDWPKAKRLGAKVLKRAPTHADLLHLLGAVALREDDYPLAQDYMYQSLEHEPDKAVFLYDYGLVLQKQRNLTDAMAYYEKALAIDKNLSQAHNNWANILAEQGNMEDAEFHYQQVLELRPEDAQTYNNLGVLYKKAARLDEAVIHYRKAIAYGLENYQIYANLANALLETGDLSEAESCYRKALNFNEKSAYLLAGLGDALRELGRFSESMTYYQQSIELEPDNQEVQWNIALTLLGMGNLTDGWLAYDWRLQAGRTYRDFGYPEWDGSSLLDKTLLIYAEQGIGDEILFASCFHDVIAMVGRCIIECEPRLETLYQRSFPRAIVRGAIRKNTEWIKALEPVDAQIPVGSLPLYLRRDFSSFPMQARYLLADPERCLYWTQYLQKAHPVGLKVGVIWRSGVMDGRRKRRFSSLLQWQDLLSTSGVTFFNLQYDLLDGELDDFEQATGIRLEHLEGLDLKQDFNELAACLTGLDLIIGAGTSTVALAAALGKPVWKLDPFMQGIVDLGQDYSPWFPSVALFRQPHWQDWDTPLQAMTQALRQWVDEARNAEVSKPFVQTCRYGRMTLAGELGIIGRSLLNYGEYAQTEMDFFLQLLDQGATVIDIGAHWGECTLGFAEAVGENGRVFAFEADPDSFQWLRQNVENNQLIQIHCQQALVSGQAGAVSLWQVKAYEPSTDNQDISYWQQSIEVVCLDALSLPQCDLIRINQANFEPYILQGAAQVIKKYRPFIYIENYRESAAIGLLQTLQALGYDWMTQRVPLFNTQNFLDNQENVFQDSVIVNLLAMPKVTLHG